MPDPRVEVIRRLARREATGPLARTLRASRPPAIAEALERLAPHERRLVLDAIESDEVLAEVLVRLDPATLEPALKAVSLDRLAALLDALEPDDAARIMELLDEEARAALLDKVEARERALLEDMLTWPEETAGRILQPLPFCMPPEATCREAIEALQQGENLEVVFYLYVVTHGGKLVGVVSLRELLRHPPSTRLDEIMTTDLITVEPETDQEEVAEIAARYGLLAVPVVDSDQVLLGIVTMDDLMDVVRDEAMEDMMLMAGVDDDPDQVSPFRRAKGRIRWLIFTMMTGMVIAEVIGRFQGPLSRNLVLAGFMPVVMGMGGNVGSQAATIMVRNIALGRVRLGEGVLRRLLKEAQVGLILGSFFGLVLLSWTMIRHEPPAVAAAIGLSIFLAQLNASILGSVVPIALSRLGTDPAIATGPLVSTFIDLATVLIYFNVSTRVFGL